MSFESQLREIILEVAKSHSPDAREYGTKDEIREEDAAELLLHETGVPAPQAQNDPKRQQSLNEILDAENVLETLIRSIKMNEKDLEQIVRKAVMDVLKDVDMSSKYVADADEYYGGKGRTQAQTAELLDEADRIAMHRAENPLDPRPPRAPGTFKDPDAAVRRAERLTGETNLLRSLAGDYMSIRGYDSNAIEKRASIVEEAIKSTNITADDFRMYANKYFR